MPGEEGRAGEGRQAPPATAAPASPAADPRVAAPQLARRLATSPGAARRPGAGGGGRGPRPIGARLPRPLPRRSKPPDPVGGCAEQPQSPRTPGREGLQPVTEEWSRGGSPGCGAGPGSSSSPRWAQPNSGNPQTKCRGETYGPRRGDITCHPRISKRSFWGRCGRQAPPLGKPGGRR